MGPAPTDQISEQAAIMRTSYPHRTDRYGLRFGKGHRTALQVRGRRPVTHVARRAMRAI